MNEEQEIRGQEVDEEQFFGSRLPLDDIAFWCPSCEDEILIREDREERCPICGCFPVEPL